jgi:hypothetical protein
VDDRQDVAEALDSDKIDDRDDYAGDLPSVYPPDEPLGVDAYGVTAQQDKIDEPLGERADHEEPDPLVEELDLSVALEDLHRRRSGAADDDPSVEREADAFDETAEAANGAVGRLVDDEAVVDTESDAVARAVDAGPEPLSAEEDAVHRTADPGFGAPGDGYVTDR